jgi:hypothetical protein
MAEGLGFEPTDRRRKCTVEIPAPTGLTPNCIRVSGLRGSRVEIKIRRAHLVAQLVSPMVRSRAPQKIDAARVALT